MVLIVLLSRGTGRVVGEDSKYPQGRNVLSAALEVFQVLQCTIKVTRNVFTVTQSVWCNLTW